MFLEAFLKKLKFFGGEGVQILKMTYFEDPASKKKFFSLVIVKDRISPQMKYR